MKFILGLQLWLLAAGAAHAATLHEAVAAGDLATVQASLARESKVLEQTNNHGQRPLHLAVPHPRIVEFLLAQGANPNPLTPFEVPPLYLAAESDHVAAAELLLRAKADPNRIWTNSLGPLHLATMRGNTDMIRLLLRHGAEVDLKEKGGHTPLHMAARLGQLRSARLLLEAGADRKAKNRFGFQPFDLVGGADNDELASLLDPTGTPFVAPRQVGSAGDPERLLFRGNKTFSATSIRNGLRMNPEFLLVSHFAAPWHEYLPAVQRLILVGYQAGGFPDAKVNLHETVKGGKIEVTVEEGPRFVCGQIQIEGARRLPVETFVRQLTTSQPRRDKVSTDNASGMDRRSPIWNRGEPATFAAIGQEQLRAAIREMLPEFGLFFPQVQMEIIPERTTNTAALKIVIEDEGPAGHLEEINLTGNKRDSDAVVMAFLDLSTNTVLTYERLKDLENKLWRSARYRASSVRPELAPDTKKIRLRIDLIEYEEAPPLNQMLDAAAQTVLRTRDWLQNMMQREEEFVATVSNFPPDLVKSGQFILSPSGVAAVFRPDATQTKISAAWFLTTNGLGYVSPLHGRKIFFPALPQQVAISLSLLPSLDPELAPVTLSFAAGLTSQEFAFEEGTRSPFNIDLVLAPVTFLNLLQRDGKTNRLEKNVLLVEGTNELARLDVATGRIFELHFHDEDGRIDIRVASNALARTIAQVEQAGASLSNSFSPARPLSSLVGFGLRELSEFTWPQSPGEELTRWRHLAGLCRLGATFAEAGVLQPLDELLVKFLAEESEMFVIPMQFQPEADGGSQVMAFVAAWVHRLSNDLFPQGSWPWTVPREAVFVLTGNTRFTGLELERLYESPDIGPLGFLSVATLLSHTSSPHSKSFAARGLNRLGLDEFRKDCRLVLQGQPVLVQTMERLAEALANMTPEQLAQLDAVLGADLRKQLVPAIVVLRATKAAPLHERLQPLLDLLWDQALRLHVERHLKELTADHPPAEA